MKNILEINILNETGSTGRIMQDIADVLENSNRYTVYTAYGYGNSNKENSIKVGNQISYTIHNVGSRLFCNQGCYSKYSTRKLINFIKEKRINLVHLHNIHGNYINFKELFIFLKNINVPIIWTLHDCWPMTGKCVYFDWCQCSKWKTGCNNCPALKSYPQSILIDQSKKYYKIKKDIFTSVNKMYFVTPSEWLANIVKQSYLKEYPVTVINNGIDLSKFHYYECDLRKRFNLTNKKIILGVASPWSKRKGLNDFIRLEKLLDEDYQIVMIGVDDKQKELIPESILTIQKTNNEVELAKWYSIADVFVNTTYEDNFPTVNLESLACNTPVVTYDTGGSVEVINQNTGLICKKGDIEELYKCIKFIINNIDNYKHCDSYAKNNFDKNKKFMEYLNLYNSIFKELESC